MLGGAGAPAARYNLRRAGTWGPMWKQNTSFRKPRPSTSCPELTEQSSSGASEPCPSGKQTIDNDEHSQGRPPPCGPAVPTVSKTSI